MDNNEKKDLTDITVYLTKMEWYKEICDINPSKENVSIYNKYYKLYFDEYKKLFNKEPDIELVEFSKETNETKEI